MEQHFSWFQFVPGLSQLPDHTATATVVAGGLIWCASRARRQLRAAPDPVIPDGTLTMRNALEIAVEFVAGMAESILGPKARSYLPLYGSFFLFIVVSNFVGFIPGISPPTSNFNVTFGLGVTSFLMYNYFGFRAHGVGYLKHFLGPMPLLAVLMVPLEIIDNCVRPLTLGMRLAANMTADHLVVGIFTDLTMLVVPVAFLILGSLVCVVQAFVFTMLSLVYVSFAVAGHGDHDTEHAHH